MNPWTVELLVVRERASESERRVLARDRANGLLVRVRPGVYVERLAFEALSPEGRHLVRMRAFAAVSTEPPIFCHQSAAVLHGFPLLDARLDRVHVLVEGTSGRGLVGVAAHVARIDHGVAFIGTLRTTDAARTVVDVARASAFEAGVVVADGALHAGVGRAVLEEAVAAAAGRPGAVRAQHVVAFARPEAESAAESVSRVSMMRMGIEPPALQVVVHDEHGFAGRLDFGFLRGRVGGEVDGEKKYRLAGLAPTGAADAVIAEKRREDRVRRQLDDLARWGWREARSTVLLAPVLASARVLPARPRATMPDYSTAFLIATL